jgi:CBS domain-containing protein
MRRRGVGCLPVVERHKLVGLVTVSQLLGVLERTLAD